jgi:regulator of cell morphogenesis and NO signaling
MNAVPSARLPDMTVRDLALSDLRLCAALMAAGVHFGEDAAHTLGELCRRRAIDAVLAERVHGIAGIEATGTVSHSLDGACAAIVSNHHVPLRGALDALRHAFSGLARAFDSDRTLIEGTRVRLEQLAEAVHAHFAKEEYILFPALAALAEAHERGGALPRLPFPSVSHPIRVMEGEHERIEHNLAWLESFAADFEVSDARDEAWLQFRRQLADLAEQLTSHAHFENDYLFPWALDVEQRLLSREEVYRHEE